MIPNFGTIGNSVGSVILPPAMNFAKNFQEEDCLFAKISEWEQEITKGNVQDRSILDAGTGVHSLQWISSMPCKNWAAVSASEEMTSRVRQHPLIASNMREGKDEVVLGHWGDPHLLEGQEFDVVIADYLIGSIDGFEPFTQDLIFERLRRCLQTPSPSTSSTSSNSTSPFTSSSDNSGDREDDESSSTEETDSCIHKTLGGRLYIIGLWEIIPENSDNKLSMFLCISSLCLICYMISFFVIYRNGTLT